MKNFMKYGLLSILLANFLQRDVKIELFKVDTKKVSGGQDFKINDKILNDEELKNGYSSEYTEDFYYLKVIDKKPVLNNEKMGVQYNIKRIDNDNFDIDINIKTDKMVETLGANELIINSRQKTFDISEFKVKSKKIQANIVQEKEQIRIEIGNEYYLTIEKLTKEELEKIGKI